MLGGHVEQSPDVGSDGAARGGYGGFESDAAAEGYGEGRGYDGTVGAAGGQFAAMARDGEKHPWDAVADVAFEDFLYEEDGQRDAYHGIDQHQRVAAYEGLYLEAQQGFVGVVDEVFEYYCRQTCQQAYQYAGGGYHYRFGNVPYAPGVEPFIGNLACHEYHLCEND